MKPDDEELSKVLAMYRNTSYLTAPATKTVSASKIAYNLDRICGVETLSPDESHTGLAKAAQTVYRNTDDEDFKNLLLKFANVHLKMETRCD